MNLTHCTDNFSPRRRRKPMLAMGCALLAGLATASFAPAAEVKIDTGLLSGGASAKGDVTIYKGIPFAAPPVGALRWKSPQPAAAWQGVRKADQFGPICMQAKRPAGPPPGASTGAPAGPPVGNAEPQSEDCLYLNVWTPAKSPTEKLPVMMWIYGGGFSGGSGSDPSSDGEELARKGVVVVTLNYRLGILGFLAHKELDAESRQGVSGNYGLLDQIAALQWISRNIAAFGGDPKRVTIFGQSAGAGSTQLLSISPLARGLFQQAITESGMFYLSDPEARGEPPSAKKLAQAQDEQLAYLKQNGADSLAKLRAMTTEQLSNLPRAGAPMGGAFFSPVLDGYVIADTYGNSYRKGINNPITFIMGGTHDERYPTPYPVNTVADFQKWGNELFGSMAPDFFKVYPVASDSEVPEMVNTVKREWGRASKFLWAELYTQATHLKVYTYDWNYPKPNPAKGLRGATHGSEIPYVFNSLAKTGKPHTPEEFAIADTMTVYWSNFAKTGDPNGKGLPPWTPHAADAKLTMQLGEGNGMIPILSDERFQFFKRFFESLPPVL